MEADLGRPESPNSAEIQGHGSVVEQPPDCKTSGGPNNALRNIVREKARIYLDSNPGAPNAALNISAHNGASLCLGDKPISIEELQKLHILLSYRIQANESAKTLLKTMQVEPICAFENFTTDDYIALDEDRVETLPDPLMMIAEAEIIADPKSTEGREYPKPFEFVAASLIKAGVTSKQDIEDRIALVVRMRDEFGR